LKLELKSGIFEVEFDVGVVVLADFSEDLLFCGD
jgi:hypothetical protein